ncbi:hypothetical protein CAI21_05675 [Alkalilimnicola ehrlichii]|uniref:N-acetyltransferase domain-containing protein n=2 Tax=Alkalilimnicola ehrlichii TaxID=351052 RepID=A0A3E0WYL8_9GAMM|nr:hypothetical protein CAI21_05675 [Alkalilimnicola ehrlichii]RFA38082.1 hypothetical protein CAL65_07045 [Alkalilimnicola ehrlichii]
MWNRYVADLDKVPPAPAHVTLTPVTDDIIEQLENHPDSAHNQLISGIRFWRHGLRRAYIWLDNGEPVCIQWLLLPEDNALIARLPNWSGMYPPLEPGTGRVENLFKFTSPAKRRSVAVNFEFAMYEQARRLGLRQILTHIHALNEPANRFADGAAFLHAGTIRRYDFGVPGLRQRPLYLHEVADPRESQSVLSLESAA